MNSVQNNYDSFSEITEITSYNSIYDNRPQNMTYSSFLAGMRLAYVDTDFAERYLTELSKSSDQNVLESIAIHENIPMDVLQAFVYKKYDSSVKAKAAINLRTTPKMLSYLAKVGSVNIRGNVVKNRKTRPKDIVRIVRDKQLHYNCGSEIFEGAWKNPNTPQELLEYMVEEFNRHIPASWFKPYSESGGWWIDHAAKEDDGKNKPEGFLRKYYNHENFKIRKAVAATPTTPHDILGQLSKDRKVYVRETVADNKNCPADILEHLSKDPDDDVKTSVAANKNTSPEVLDYLAREDAPRKEPRVCPISHYVAENSNTAEDTLRYIAKNRIEKFWVVKSLCENPNTPVDILIEFAKNPPKSESSTRRYITENPKITEDVAKAIINYGNIRDIKDLVLNKDVPASIILELDGYANKLLDNEYPEAELGFLQVIGGNPNLPEKTMRRIAKSDKYWTWEAVDELPDKRVYIRRGVAMNISAPYDVLKDLATDENDDVRECIVKNPSIIKYPDILLEMSKDIVISIS